MFYLTNKKYIVLLFLSSLRQGGKEEVKRRKGRGKERKRKKAEEKGTGPKKYLLFIF